MVSTVELIKCQQQILKELGLYGGAVDGIWNIQSQNAFLGFLHSPNAAGVKPRPAIAFFSPFEPLPNGWAWDDSGLITVSGIDTTVVLTPVVESQPVVAPVVAPVQQPIVEQTFSTLSTASATDTTAPAVDPAVEVDSTIANGEVDQEPVQEQAPVQEAAPVQEPAPVVVQEQSPTIIEEIKVEAEVVVAKVEETTTIVEEKVEPVVATIEEKVEVLAAEVEVKVSEVATEVKDAVVQGKISLKERVQQQQQQKK